MGNFQGIEDFVNAITGDAGVVPGQEFSRLAKQRSEQVSLDRKLEQLSRDKELLERDRNINENRNNLSTSIEDDLLRSLVLGGTGVGTNFAAGQKGLKTGIESEALRAALDAVLGAQAGGNELPTDFVNALTGVSSGKLLAPTNVQVQAQAASDLSSSDSVTALNEGKLNDLLPAQVESVNALTGQRNAAAERSANPATAGRLNLENLTADQIGLLGGQEIDVESDNPIARFFGMGGSKEVSPDFFPEFMKFQAENAMLDPRFQDATFALTKFLEFKDGGSATVAGASEAPASPTGQVAKFVRDENGNLVLVQ